MSEQARPPSPGIPAPEPDLTPEAIVARARALIPAIREQQDEAEKLGHHTPELDKNFTDAGFYRILQPKRFGMSIYPGHISARHDVVAAEVARIHFGLPDSLF